ncbi:MAG: hypothetical protein EPO21_01435 [Chloroflexota bacterium]|nr:MAG: hypothetical protein EPO21_01435 [Chloroflexota bacterium]
MVTSQTGTRSVSTGIVAWCPSEAAPHRYSAISSPGPSDCREDSVDFCLEQRRLLLRDSIRDFVKKECASTFVREIDRQAEWPATLYEGLAELGYLGILFPEEYSGVGCDALDLALVAEELSCGCYALAVAYRQSIVLGGMSVALGGADDLKREVLPSVAEGKTTLTWALTERDISSDAGYITTVARPEGGGYVVNGTKMFIYGADRADHCTVIARTSGEPGDRQGITVLLVPLKGTPGISMRPLRKMGTWPVKAFELQLRDVAVPATRVLGTVDEGWSLVRGVLDLEYIASAASSVGISQRMVDDASAYVKQRVQFDTVIGKFQAVAHMVVDMLSDVELMRYMTYRAALMHAQGLPCTKEVALAKLYCSRSSERVGKNGVQVMGGYGYMAEFDMERNYRDSRREAFASGSSLELHGLVAKLMGL